VPFDGPESRIRSADLIESHVLKFQGRLSLNVFKMMVKWIPNSVIDLSSMGSGVLVQLDRCASVCIEGRTEEHINAILRRVANPLSAFNTSFAFGLSHLL